MSEVRATMKQRGVTQWSLAKRAGMDHRNMSRLLRGGKRGPWLSTLETIANALGMNLRVTLEKKP
jgi:transcriptional regulator with XRE-family HTH domain